MLHKPFFILFMLFGLLSKAQTTYQFSTDIQNAIDKDTLAWRYQIGATNFSISGYHTETLKTWLLNGARKQNHKKEDTLFYSNSSKLDAKQYILNQSKLEEIIIINEAHHLPMHRVFTASLLKGLYANGYRYLALEALADTAINSRKFANLNSGYYTSEPQFGNLIQEALLLGFTVFGYEATAGNNGKEREIEQAKNIQQFLADKPKGKLIVHCGFSHVFENEYKPWKKAMAGRLKEYSGIDPFTIDQELYTEKGEPAYNPTLVNLNKEGKPIVLKDGNGTVFKGNRAVAQTDIVVIHPATQMVDNRPSWLATGKRKTKVALKNLKQLPALVLAYRKGELENNGVPADIIEVSDEKSPAYLYLDAGKYHIQVKNRDYQNVAIYTITVK